MTDNLDLWTSVLLTKSTAGRGSNGKLEAYGIKKLRELILELAVRGELVPQNPNDEPARTLLKKIAKEKARLIKEGVIKKQSPLAEIEDGKTPFDIPDGWIWLRLGEIGYTQTGGTPIKTNKEYFGSDIPFIKPGDIYPNYVDYNNEGLSCEGHLALGRSAPANSILMVCIGTIGKCNSIDRPCAFNQQINSITPYIPITDFLLKAMSSNYFQTEAWQRSSSTTIAILNKGKWNDIIVPLPSLAEQHRIVAKVDELMALCDQLEQKQTDIIEAHQTLVETLLGTLTNIESQQELNEAWTRIADHFDTLFTTEQSIDQLKQTILQLAVMGKLVPQDPNDEPAALLLTEIQEEKRQMIEDGRIREKDAASPIIEEERPFEVPRGWHWARLSEITRRIHYGYTASARPEIETIRLLRITDIQNNFVDWSTVPGCEVEDKDLSQYKLELSDILVARTGGTVGKTFLVRELPVTAVFASYLIRIQGASALYDRYLKLFLESPTYWEQLVEGARGGAQPNVNGQTLGRMVVPVAPKSEQQRIVAKVDELMALCDALKARLSDAQTTQIHLTDSIVEQAVA